MKEINNIIQDKIEIVKQVNQKKQLQYLGSLKPNKNHQIFQLCLNTGIVELVKFESLTLVFNETDKKIKRLTAIPTKKIVVKEQHLYTSALNLKNAVNKFKKMLNFNK
jgi:hypothetical protein